MPSPNIAFDTIPSSIRKPGKYIEFNTRLAVRTLPGNLQKTLIIGQRLSSGSVTSDATLIDIFSDIDAAVAFGYGSIAHLMCSAAIKANRYLSLQCIALVDAVAGTLATQTLTITGTPGAVGVLTVAIGDQTVQIAVATTDTATTLATSLVAQIAKQNTLPITSAAVAGVVTLTAKHKGTLGNSIKVSATALAGTLPISGLTVAVAVGVTGATDPVIATALATVFSAGHNIIISAWNDAINLTALRTHLDSVSGALELRGAIGIYGWTDTYALAIARASAINSGRIACCFVPAGYENSYEIAAAFGSVVASEEDPARPLNTLALTGVLANPLANRSSRTEQEGCLYNGVTPTEVGPGDKVQIVRAVTTYTVDANSITDISMLDLTTIRTLDYVRKAVRERIALRFPREKLSSRTAAKVRSEIIDVLYKLEELEIIEGVDDNLTGVIVERDSQDPNRLDAKIPTNVVNGLHIFAARIDLLL